MATRVKISVDLSDIDAMRAAVREAVAGGDGRVMDEARIVRDAVADATPRRSGAMAERWKTRKAKGSTGIAAANVSNTHPGVATLDEGGVITPNTADWLRVPIGDTLPSPFVPLTKIRTRSGGFILAERTGDDLTPRFALVQRVQIRGRGFIEPAFSGREDVFAEQTADTIAAKLNGDGG